MLFLITLVLGLSLWAVNDNLKSERRRRINAESRAKRAAADGLEFIRSFQFNAKPSEKPVLDKMVATYRIQHGLPDEFNMLDVPVPPPEMMSPEAKQQYLLEKAQPETRPLHQDIDNESLLLYFGAFLFVAAAGLFVWLGRAPGLLKCLVVILVTAILYVGGIRLYRQRAKLRQAAQAFVGIGIVLAPLTGVSAYSYVLGQRHGYLVWMFTSAVCLALYLHAFSIFRSGLTGYLLIFTLLSLFESGIGVAALPIYAYGWGLAFLAIAMQAMTYLRKWQPELESPSAQSAELFIPLSILVAVVMAPNLGMFQLGVSLLLAAAYHGLSFLVARGTPRRTHALISQSAATLAIPLLA